MQVMQLMQVMQVTSMGPEKSVWKELEREWRSPEEVAKLLEVDSSTVYRWLRSGLLGGLQLGKKWRISSRDMNDFLQRQRRKQQEKQPLECPVCGRRPECPWCGRLIDV
jgi:excisionase family DNA binding protein